MELSKKQKIQITKFGWYGLLKNLKFYEPFLIVFFFTKGISLLEIGFLYSIREIMIYVFEIPSGVLADRYGKKTELIICFLFYIISFILFFLGTSYMYYIIAMVFFGLGEAFRSGTHKAMIMTFLDRNEMSNRKGKIYGKTRSYSLIGSTISSLMAVFFVLVLPEIRYLFILAIIPYILDLLLIITYPEYLNERVETSFRLVSFLKENVRSVVYAFKDKRVNKLLFSSASYQAGFKTIKDYIQPILVTMTLSVILFQTLSVEDNKLIYIGVIYSIIYLISAFVSRNAYKLTIRFNQMRIIKSMWLLSGIALLVMSFYINSILIVSIVFLLLYVFLNIRKPLMIEVLGDATDKSKRASVLSIESQVASLLIAVCAPVLGFIATEYGIGVMIFICSMVMILIYVFDVLFIKKQEN